MKTVERIEAVQSVWTLIRKGEPCTVVGDAHAMMKFDAALRMIDDERLGIGTDCEHYAYLTRRRSLDAITTSEWEQSNIILDIDAWEYAKHRYQPSAVTHEESDDSDVHIATTRDAHDSDRSTAPKMMTTAEALAELRASANARILGAEARQLAAHPLTHSTLDMTRARVRGFAAALLLMLLFGVFLAISAFAVRLGWHLAAAYGLQ